MRDEVSRLGEPCDRRRFLIGASLVGIGAASTRSLWAEHEPVWQVSQQQLTEGPVRGSVVADLQMFRVLDGHGWGRQLANVELDLLTPGGRVLAWTWNRELDAAPPVQMPVPRGTELEVTLVFTSGRRHSHRVAIADLGSFCALSLTPGRPPLWCLEPEDDFGHRTHALEATSLERADRGDGFALFLELTTEIHDHV